MERRKKGILTVTGYGKIRRFYTTNSLNRYRDKLRVGTIIEIINVPVCLLINEVREGKDKFYIYACVLD